MADNQYNDPLERFFRKKAGEYNIQYNEKDWLKLESRLDKADSNRANQRRWQLAAAAVLLLFSVLGYITYEQQQKINQLNERLTNAENIGNLPNEAEGILIEPPSPQNKEEDNRQEPPQNIAGAITGSENSVIASDETSGLPSDFSEEREYEEVFTSQHNEQTIQLANIRENSLAATLAKFSPGVDGRSPAISAITPPNFNASISGLTKNPEEGSLIAAKNSRIPQTSRFTVGVLLGPDISTVGGLSDFYDPGHKIGMTLEYNITQNLALSVGALHSKVRYKASGNEYQPPQSYWSYGVAPDHTIGECILIDIPITLKYDFLHFHQSRLYATAGASSYIMLDEDYRFNYGSNNSSGLQQRWHKRTGTPHWMSNATLSVGYEYDLSQTLSIRAEPFLRIPLQEVGWGNVKLYSMGSFISLNYNFH